MTTTDIDPTEVFLSRLGSDLRVAARRRLRRQRQWLTAAAGTAAVALLAGGAFAATQALWSGTDMTAADIARQATIVANDTWSECDKDGHCTTTTGTHTQVNILPAMGVTFVLPSGHTVSIVPAEPILPGLPTGSSDGTLQTTTDAAGEWTGGSWTVDLPGGGERTITWNRADGSVSVTDDQNGKTTSSALRAGDVVPLIPGSLDPQARTLDKAVTFDLPTGNRVIIFPTLNETYIDWVQSQSSAQAADPLPANTAAKYGLVPIGEYNGELPVTSDGGTWTVQLPDGTERTISWQAGQASVTISDRSPSGAVQETDVPIGHELPLIPFS